MPGAGTSAHAFTLVHSTADGTRRGRGIHGPRSRRSASAPPCSSTPTTSPTASRPPSRSRAPELGGVRIDSGDLGVLARQVRKQLDDLGAHNTQIVVSGDLDEYAIAALRAEPVDVYGVGTALVTGSGAPTCGMVYKLVEVDGMPVAKRSSHKESRGGTKRALRRFRSTGTMIEEVVYPAARCDPPATRLRRRRPRVQSDEQRELLVAMVRDGEQVDRSPGP